MATQHRYELVYHTIKHRIEEELYPESSRIPSSRDLAAEFGTTPVTIDRALAMLVTDGYINRVPKSGSYVNSHAQWQETKDAQTASGLIGAIVFDASVSFYWSQVVAGIEEAVSAGGMHLVVGHSQHDPDRAIRYVEELDSKGIEGFIFVPIDMPDSESYERENRRVVDVLERTGKPFILFDRILRSRACSAVSIESTQASRAMAQSLLEAGSKNPICISVHHASVTGDREKAFIDVLTENGITDAESRVHRLPTERVRDAQLSRIEDILANQTDGVFCINSSVTNALLKVVPGAKSSDLPLVVGFEELELTMPQRLLQIAHQPVQDVALSAGNLIVNLVRGTVDPMWRDSTAHLTFSCKPGPVRTATTART